MKKTLLTLVCLLFCLLLFGCSSQMSTNVYPESVEQKEYNVIWDVTFAGDAPDISTALSHEDSKLLADIMKSEKWINDLSDCAPDVTLISENGDRIRYHSECGVFNDLENIKSLKLDPSQKEIVNNMLKSYGRLGPIELVPSEPEGYEFSAQYIRTDIKSGGEYSKIHLSKTPWVHVVDTREELDAYYAEYKDCFDLERKSAIYSDETIWFLDACDKYNDEYFEEHNLVIIFLHESSSGSIRHEITDVRKDDLGGWVISVDRLLPEERTDDEAGWHLLLEIQMGKIIDAKDTVSLNINDVEISGAAINKSPVTVTSNDETITPYPHFAYSSDWIGDGFLAADGTPLQWELPELAKQDLLPGVYFNDDFSVSYAENISMSHILVYDKDFNQMETMYDFANIMKLKEGTYYIGVVVNEQGKFIDEANEYENNGWACAFILRK